MTAHPPMVPTLRLFVLLTFLFALTVFGGFVPSISTAQTDTPTPVLLAEGPVGSAQFTPNGSRVVYVTASSGSSRLFSVPFSGGTPTPLSPESTIVGDFRITADGAYVVFTGETEAQVLRPSLYVVPTSGGAVQTLAEAPTFNGISLTYVVLPDSSGVVFRYNLFPGTPQDLFIVSFDGEAPRRVNEPLATSEDVLDWRLSPDGTRIIYAIAQPNAPEQAGQLYSVPVTGGERVDLDSTYQSASSSYLIFSSDGTQVIYPKFEPRRLVAVPITGGSAQLLAIPESDGILSLVSAGDRVVFSAIPTNAPTAIYSSALDGSGEAINLTADRPEGSAVSDFEVSADGARVIYKVQPLATPQYLVSVPVVGGASTAIQPGQGGNAGINGNFYLSPDSTRVVFFEASVLRSAPIEGGDAVTIATDLSFAGGQAYGQNFRFVNDGAQLIFRSGLQSDGTRAQLFITNVREASEPIVISGDVPFVAGEPASLDFGVTNFAVNEAGTRVIFRGATSSTAARSLYAVVLNTNERVYLPVLFQ